MAEAVSGWPTRTEGRFGQPSAAECGALAAGDDFSRAEQAPQQSDTKPADAAVTRSGSIELIFTKVRFHSKRGMITVLMA